MPNIIQANVNAVFTDNIEAYANGENVVETVLNRPIAQVSLNTGWLKQRISTVELAKEDKIIKKSAFNKDFGVTAGTVTQGNDPRLSDARTPLPHSHSLSQLSLDFSGQGFLYFNGTALVINNTPNTGSSTVDWSAITGIPSSFRSSVSLVDGLGIELAKKANLAHSHSISDITGLRAELDSLSGINVVVPTHTHTIAQVSGLSAALAGKAAVVHTHTPDQIVGLVQFIQQNTPIPPPVVAPTATLITRQIFVRTTSSSFTLSGEGTVFKVTVNGFDLDESEWSQGGTSLIVPAAESGDSIIVYRQGTVSPTMSKINYTSVAGNNNFTVATGFSAWQVLVNGIDIESFTQAGSVVSVNDLTAGDSVSIYLNKI